MAAAKIAQSKEFKPMMQACKTSMSKNVKDEESSFSESFESSSDSGYGDDKKLISTKMLQNARSRVKEAVENSTRFIPR